MLALSLPLRRLRVTFVLNTMIALNELFSGPRHSQKTYECRPCDFVDISLEMRMLDSVICTFPAKL